MTARDKEFLDFYEHARIDDQLGYYRARAAWNGRSNDSMIVLIGLLMFVAAVSAAVVAAKWDWLGPPVLWMVLATLVPVLSSALAATRSLYGYEQNHLRFDTTYLDLRYLRAYKRPGAELEDAAFRAGLADYIGQVEELMSKEHRQWMQITKEIPLPEPRQPSPPRPPESDEGR